MDWIGALVDLDKPPNTKLISWKGLPVHLARNRLAQDAISLGVKFLFFLDSDVLPPRDAIMKLMGWRVPIIAGVYWAKRGYPAIWQEDPQRPGGYIPVRDLGNVTIREVDAVGAGCMLIDVRAFKVVPFPWFEWTIEDPMIPKGLSEDLGWCRKAWEHGLKVYIDRSVECQHETVLPVNLEGQIVLGEQQSGQLARLGQIREA